MIIIRKKIHPPSSSSSSTCVSVCVFNICLKDATLKKNNRQILKRKNEIRRKKRKRDARVYFMFFS